jgi:hypothetical protein
MKILETMKQLESKLKWILRYWYYLY